MALEDRDWYRADPPSGRGQSFPGGFFGIVVAIVAVFGVIALGQRLLFGPEATYGGKGEKRSAVKISLLPGTPGVTIGGGGLYPANDPWEAYLADERTCPGGERTDLAPADEAGVMVCLVNWARKKRGLNALALSAVINTSSVAKASRIERCRDFNHDACGEPPSSEIRQAGYHGAWGENLYIATGRLGAPRVALDRWLNSTGHRENLFRPEWAQQGIAVVHLDRFGHDRDMWLWVNQFGDP